MTLPKFTILHLLAISLAVNVALGVFVGYHLLNPGPAMERVTAGRPLPAPALPPTYAVEAASPVMAAASGPVAPASSVAPVAARVEALESSAAYFANPSVPQVASTPGAQVPLAKPGNSFPFRGMTVAVEGETTTENGAPSLLISVEEGPVRPGTGQGGPAAVADPQVATAAPNQAGANGETQPPASSQTPPGALKSSNYEQELFRARWGSDTYSAVQAEALRAKNAK